MQFFIIEIRNDNIKAGPKEAINIVGHQHIYNTSQPGNSLNIAMMVKLVNTSIIKCALAFNTYVIIIKQISQ